MMPPYPTPIASSIERCAAAMVSQRVREDAGYCAEWSQLMLECAAQVRLLELPDTRPKRCNLEVPWPSFLVGCATIFVLVCIWGWRAHH